MITPIRWTATLLATAAALAACGGHAEREAGTGTCLAWPAEVALADDLGGASEWNDVAIDAQGRVWLAGYDRGTVGQSNIEPAGDSRAVLRRFGPDGRLQWDAGDSFDTPGTDVAEALALSPQGTLFVAGRSTGRLADTPNAGQFDAFVAWHDSPGGSGAWRSAQFGSAAPEHPRRLALDDQGGVWVAGQRDTFVPSNYVEAWSDPFAARLRRLDPGTATDRLALQWLHASDSAEPDTVDGLAVQTAAAGGSSFVTGAVQGGGASRTGMFVRKLAADGRAAWTARYSSLGADNIAAVRMLPDGDLLVAGSVYGSFDGAPWRGQQDVFVARLAAADGRVLARWQFGSSESEWVTDLQVDAAGRMVVLGETSGVMAAGARAAGGNDLFLLQLAPDGRLLAARQWGTADDERAAHLAVDRCGGVLAVGATGTVGTRRALAWFWRP